MTSCLLPLLLAPVLASPWDDALAVELRYTGALSKAGRESEGTALKRFNLYCAVSRTGKGGRRLVYTLSERGGGGWSWPERFGVVTLDDELNSSGGTGIRLLYEYEGNPVAVPLLLPVSAHATSLNAGAKWSEGKEASEVTGKQKVRDRNCWQVQTTTSFGRKRTVLFDVEAPVVVGLEERVFVGQGDEHVLTIQLESFAPLDAEQRAHNLLPVAGLQKLLADLERAENEYRPELSAQQLKLATDALPQLQKDAADTPFSALVSAISKDVKAQLQRTDEVGKLAEKFVGKNAPAFSLSLTDKTEIAQEAFKDKITVLHFWEYQGEPLVEPYGQVGYLDFLYGKRKKLGVQVFGIAVDKRLADQQANSAALKSIQRLKGFMNLGYPIAIDDGKLLTRFGDPQKYGAKLPLWVVIGPDGKIAYYHSGFFKINPDEGLRELDDVLVKLIRQQKGIEKDAGGDSKSE